MFLIGAQGPLEAILTVPTSMDQGTFALLGHPHSLYGGSMKNKVVTTLARAFEACHIGSLRFNFRGVGQSAGVYDAGVGESEDMLAVADLCRAALPDVRLVFAGFSFGSFVAYRAAAQTPHALLLSVAPPVQHFDHTLFEKIPTPWVIVQPEEDEVVPLSLVMDYVAKSPTPIPCVRIPQAGHFFHGQLSVLKSALINIISDL